MITRDDNSFTGGEASSVCFFASSPCYKLKSKKSFQCYRIGVSYQNPSKMGHVTEYSPTETGEYPGYIPQFSKPRVLGRIFEG